MISDTCKVNQSRMLIIRKILWISKSFATNTSWCIRRNTEFIWDVIKPVAMDLSSGNLSKRCVNSSARETIEVNVNKIV